MADRGGRGGRGGGGGGGRGGASSKRGGGGRGGAGGGGNVNRGAWSGVGGGDSSRGGAARGGGGDNSRGGAGGGRGGSGSNRGEGRGGPGSRGGRGNRGRGGGGSYGPPPVYQSPHGPPKVDERVRRLEDATLKKLHSSTVEDLSKKAQQLTLGSTSTPGPSGEFFPIRPAFGTNGEPVVLWANYFALKIQTPVLMKYSVEIVEVGKDKSKPPKGSKLYLAMEQVLKHIGSDIVVATEYKSQLITREKLKLDSDAFKVQIPGGKGLDSFDVTISGPSVLDMDELGAYLQNQDLRPDDHVFPRFPECVGALNVIFGFSPRSQPDQIASLNPSRFFPFGDKFSAERAIKALSQRFGPRPLEALRGFVQSVRPATGQLLLNANVTCGIFRRSGQAVTIFQQLRITDVSRPNADRHLLRHLHNVARVMKKARVLVHMKVANDRVVKARKTVYNLAVAKDIPKGGKNPPRIDKGYFYPGPYNVKFFLQEGAGGRYITVADHYKTKYGVNLGNYPVFNLGNAEKHAYYPAEFVEFPPGQPVKTKLTGEETTDMLDHACNDPSFNANLVEIKSRRVLGLESDLLDAFGIHVDKKLLAVEGRKLPAPGVSYNKRDKLSPVLVSKGSWNYKANQVVRGANIGLWSVLQIRLTPAGHIQSDKFLDEFSVFMRDCGLIVSKRIACPFPALPLPEVEEGNKLDEVFKWAKANGIKFLLIIFSSKAEPPLYGRIKVLGDCIYGIHTSCMVADKMTKGGMSYAANIVLKLNLKAGGINQKLTQDIKLIRGGKTMVMGYDVTHPTNMATSSSGNDPPSLVGMVASVDADLGQWPSTSWEQTSRQEMLGDALATNFKHHLDLWQKKNKSLPANILIYRDGVSEGQFAQVLEQEVPLMRKACREKYGKKALPRMTIVVSVKRHQTRFYPAVEGRSEGATGNVEAGTVVDRGVTQARYWDFFLTAHHALKGTARPARYTVLMDEIFRADHGNGAANELEKITHEMCYMFGRATKAVSICPPAYYADIVCERARAHRPEMFDVSDLESVATSHGGSSSSARAPGPSVHKDLADSMYYV